MLLTNLERQDAGRFRDDIVRFKAMGLMPGTLVPLTHVEEGEGVGVGVGVGVGGGVILHSV